MNDFRLQKDFEGGMICKFYRMKAHSISMCHHRQILELLYIIKQKYIGSMMLPIAVLLRGQHGLGV